MVKYKLTELIEHVLIQYIPIGLLVTHAHPGSLTELIERVIIQYIPIGLLVTHAHPGSLTELIEHVIIQYIPIRLFSYSCRSIVYITLTLIIVTYDTS